MAPPAGAESVGLVVGTGSLVKNTCHRSLQRLLGLLEPAIAFVLCCCVRLNNNVKMEYATQKRTLCARQLLFVPVWAYLH